MEQIMTEEEKAICLQLYNIGGNRIVRDKYNNELYFWSFDDEVIERLSYMYEDLEGKFDFIKVGESLDIEKMFKK
jgi:hypothetical protein